MTWKMRQHRLILSPGLEPSGEFCSDLGCLSGFLCSSRSPSPSTPQTTFWFRPPSPRSSSCMSTTASCISPPPHWQSTVYPCWWGPTSRYQISRWPTLFLVCWPTLPSSRWSICWSTPPFGTCRSQILSCLARRVRWIGCPSTCPKLDYSPNSNWSPSTWESCFIPLSLCSCPTNSRFP